MASPVLSVEAVWTPSIRATQMGYCTAYIDMVKLSLLIGQCGTPCGLHYGDANNIARSNVTRRSIYGGITLP